MNKFQKSVSRDGDQITNERGSQISDLAKMAQESMINKLKERRINLEFRKKEMLDMSPDNRFSLVTLKDFDGKKFVEEYQKVCLDLANLEVELEIAESNLKDLFEDEDKNEGRK